MTQVLVLQTSKKGVPAQCAYLRVSFACGLWRAENRRTKQKHQSSRHWTWYACCAARFARTARLPRSLTDDDGHTFAPAKTKSGIFIMAYNALLFNCCINLLIVRLSGIETKIYLILRYLQLHNFHLMSPTAAVYQYHCPLGYLTSQILFRYPLVISTIFTHNTRLQETLRPHLKEAES